MILGYYGHDIDQREVLAALPKGSDEGPLLTDLAQLAQKLGL
jgi:ABC-type bacteriocin/lantibiotic exporter with double-glycine peptidase domain